jgi:hypothetical protein
VRTEVAAFALLAVAACGARGPASSQQEATVTGHVRSAPSCPVERLGTPCPPRAAARALVELRSGDRTVASTRTDDTGRYVLRAGPGDYVVRATGAGFGATAERAVHLDPGGTATVDLRVDSGIR